MAENLEFFLRSYKTPKAKAHVFGCSFKNVACYFLLIEGWIDEALIVKG